MDKLDRSIELVKLKYPVICKQNIAQLNQIVKEKSIDIIINQWGLPFKTTMLCNKAIKGTNCRLISVLHGSPYTSKVLLNAQKEYNQTHGLVKLYKYVKYRAIDKAIRLSIKYNVAHNERYILLSPGFIKPLIEYAHLKSAKNILAIGNPITIDVKEGLIDIEHKKNQLLYVGRMDLTNKNVNRIVETWGQIWKNYSDWKLLLVGDGPDKQYLVDYVQENKIQNIEFKGFQKDPPIKYYAESSIFLLTSDLEGFGLVVIESMSYGMVPIVYGSYEAIFDIIEEKESGFILPKPFRHKNLAETLDLLIKNRDLRVKMAYQAKKRAELFTLSPIVDKWYKLLGELLKDTK